VEPIDAAPAEVVVVVVPLEAECDAPLQPVRTTITAMAMTTGLRMTVSLSPPL
jgi:hypothetical protein